MAKITQMETSTSTEVAILPRRGELSRGQKGLWDPHPQHSQGCLRELLLGEVEGVVGGRDAETCGVGAGGQPGSQQPIAGHVEEGDHGMPALVVEPDLQHGKGQAAQSPPTAPGCACSPCSQQEHPTLPTQLLLPSNPSHSQSFLGCSTPRGDTTVTSLLPPQIWAHLDIPAGIQTLDEAAEVGQEPIRGAALGAGTQNEEGSPSTGTPELSQGLSSAVPG